MWRVLLLAAFTVPLYPQFLPDLQAKTPEEYDSYLDVLDGPVLAKGALFERRFPTSTLILPVCELMEREWRALDDNARAIEAARRGLTVAPDYPPLLVELADLLANSTSNLGEAEAAGRRAITLLETVRAPRRVSVDEWTTALSALRARARGALGQVLFKRDDVPGAIREFEAALAEPGTHDPSLHYRLGRLYLLTGRRVEGRSHLEEAARRGGKVLRERANAALAESP